MISKWKYNYTDEEKGMALTIQNLKQEIDKLVDAMEYCLATLRELKGSE